MNYLAFEYKNNSAKSEKSKISEVKYEKSESSQRSYEICSSNQSFHSRKQSKQNVFLLWFYIFLGSGRG